MTYRNCKTLINAGRYTYDSMFAMLDLFLMVGRISTDEYIERTGLLIPPVETPLAEETPEIPPEPAPESPAENEEA